MSGEVYPQHGQTPRMRLHLIVEIPQTHGFWNWRSLGEGQAQYSLEMFEDEQVLIAEYVIRRTEIIPPDVFFCQVVESISDLRDAADKYFLHHVKNLISIRGYIKLYGPDRVKSSVTGPDMA